MRSLSSRSESAKTGSSFSCGLPELDRYLARQAGQDVRRRIARVFVCTAGETDAVLGFYTLSAQSIDLASLPEQLSRKLPRHPVPCALIAGWRSIARRTGRASDACFSQMRSSGP